jgi:hypothetical protein
MDKKMPLDKENYNNYRRERRQNLRNYIYNHFKNNSCIDCGESRIACLQFDHVDPTLKKYNISAFPKTRGSIKSLQLEIDKCVVRCANCHAVKTANDLGWYKNTK